ncbi:MAG: hypothetical protein U0232_22355 [Thermomicrobiales bacterium]
MARLDYLDDGVQAVGIHPASIHELYVAAGRGEYGTHDPAINTCDVV